MHKSALGNIFKIIVKQLTHSLEPSLTGHANPDGEDPPEIQ
jgi:hypothetical protein